MPKISTKTLSLVADGKTIDLKKPSKKNFELNKALTDPAKFKEFANDPQGFASKYDLSIDKGISDNLKLKLKDVSTLHDLKTLRGPDDVSATVWAIAVGAYSVATSKVAVAF